MIYDISTALGTFSVRMVDTGTNKEWQEPMGYIKADVTDTAIQNQIRQWLTAVAGLLQSESSGEVVVNLSKSTVGYGVTVDEMLDGDTAGTQGFPANTIWKILLYDVDGNRNSYTEYPGYLHGELSDETVNKIDAMNRAIVGLSTNTYVRALLGAGFTLDY